MSAITLLPFYDPEKYRAEITRIYADFYPIAKKNNYNFHERLKYFSKIFLGRPYVGGALGEGADALIDQSPLYRHDAFDCVTYVNTVLALSLADNVEDFEKQMLRLNYYDADPVFQKRFHFQCVDWCLQNETLGVIEDITLHILDEAKQPIALTATAIIDKPQWFLQRTMPDIKMLKSISAEKAQDLLRQLHDYAKAMSKIKSEVFYLPLSRLFVEGKPQEKFFQQIFDGCIVEIVRPNWNLCDKIGTHLNISHLGFVFWIGGELKFRHASLSGKVMEESLSNYLSRFLESETVRGIQVLKTRDFSPHP